MRRDQGCDPKKVILKRQVEAEKSEWRPSRRVEVRNLKKSPEAPCQEGISGQQWQLRQLVTWSREDGVWEEAPGFCKQGFVSDPQSAASFRYQRLLHSGASPLGTEG